MKKHRSTGLTLIFRELKRLISLLLDQEEHLEQDYTFGYTVEVPPTTRCKIPTIGARQDGTGVDAVADKINCLLVSSGTSDDN